MITIPPIVPVFGIADRKRPQRPPQSVILRPLGQRVRFKTIDGVREGKIEQRPVCGWQQRYGIRIDGELVTIHESLIIATLEDA